MTRLLKRLLWDWLRLRLRWNRWRFWWRMRNNEDVADIIRQLDAIDAFMGGYDRKESGVEDEQ